MGRHKNAMKFGLKTWNSGEEITVEYYGWTWMSYFTKSCWNLGKPLLRNATVINYWKLTKSCKIWGFILDIVPVKYTPTHCFLQKKHDSENLLGSSTASSLFTGPGTYRLSSVQVSGTYTLRSVLQKLWRTRKMHRLIYRFQGWNLFHQGYSYATRTKCVDCDGDYFK